MKQGMLFSQNTGKKVYAAHVKKSSIYLGSADAVLKAARHIKLTVSCS